MKFITPFKVAMALSLLAHGVGVGVYYAVRHEANSARVEFNHQRALEVEIVSEAEQDSASVPTPVKVQSAEIVKVLPSVTASPSPTLETEPPISTDAKVLPSAEEFKLEAVAAMQTMASEPESKTIPQPATIGIASRPAASTDGGIPANYLINPKPVYPVESRKRREEGVVILAVQVNQEGLPGTVQIVESSHYQLLDEAAVQAVSQWRFTPARMGNLAMASQIEVPIRFKLSDSK